MLVNPYSDPILEPVRLYDDDDDNADPGQRLSVPPRAAPLDAATEDQTMTRSVLFQRTPFPTRV